MHPEIIQDKPGSCPKCGMHLVPVKSQKDSAPDQQKSELEHHEHHEVEHQPHDHEHQQNDHNHSHEKDVQKIIK